jgi:hypothetical protein
VSDLSLFVFVDALGWEILNRHAFLDDVLVTKRPLQTVFGYSSTCDPTIITGLSPQQHGHFSFFNYDPARSPFRWAHWLSLLPRRLTSRGRVRHWISRIVGKCLGYSGYFQLYNMPFDRLHNFDYSEKRDIYAPGGINSGDLNIFDHLRRERIPFHLSDWRKSETHNLESLSQSMSGAKPRLAYLYLAAMDAILHAEGTCGPSVAAKMAWYDQQLRQVLDQAERHYNNVRLFLFSDHGMTDVHSTLNLMPQIESLGYRFGHDYAAVYDSTMARFWFANPRAAQDIRATLDQIPEGKVLTDAQLSEYGCLFPAAKYGELFYLLNPGVLLCPSFMGERPLAGMHGYAPGDKDSVASFSSNLKMENTPPGLADLFGLMAGEVGIHV